VASPPAQLTDRSAPVSGPPRPLCTSPPPQASSLAARYAPATGKRSPVPALSMRTRPAGTVSALLPAPRPRVSCPLRWRSPWPELRLRHPGPLPCPRRARSWLSGCAVILRAAPPGPARS
jgi:hypothetical protein